MKKLYTHHSIYLLFAVCWLSYFSAYLGRLNFTACIAAINEAENLSRLELGRVSSAFFVCYGGAQLFSGLLADRLRPRLLVAVGLLGGAAVNLGMAVSSTAGQMAVLWAANGLLQSLVWTPMIKAVADLTQDAQCARTCLNLSTTTPAGTLGAYLMCVLCVASPWGWRLSFYLGGAAMAAGGALWIFGMRALERISEKSGIPDMSERQEDDAPEKVRGPWRVLACLLPAAAASVMYGLLRDGIITWAPSYLQESFGFPAATSIALTMIVPPVNLGGVYAFNWLKNRLRWSEVATAAAAFAICGAGLTLWTAAGRGSVAVTILMLIVSTTCMTGASTMLLSLLPLRFHAMGLMATVTGLLNASAYVGSALASTGFGALSESGGWTAVLAAWLAISAAGVALCFFSRGAGRTDRPAARQSRACGP